MFQLLLKARLLAARNSVLQTWRRSPALALGLTVLGAALFGVMTVGAMAFFQFAAHIGVLRETVYETFYFLFLFLLAGAVPFVASTLLQSSDYGLLFVAPVPPRLVVAAKLLDATLTNSLQFTVIGVPAIVACAFALNVPLWGWALVPFLTLLFVLLPALITALALLLALGGLGMRRVRAAVTLINVLMAVGVCLIFVLEARHLPFRLGDPAKGLASLQPAINASSPAAHLMPSQWFATALLAMSPGATVSAGEAISVVVVLTGVVFGLFGLCVLLGGRLLSAAAVAEEGASGGSVGASGSDWNLWRRFLRPPTAALIAKDWKYVARDTMLLSQLGVPMLLFVVPFLLALEDRSLNARGEVFVLCAAITGIIVFMQTSILSLSLLGLESESFWAVLTSPNARRSLLWAKWLLSTVVTGAVGIVLTLIAGGVFGASLSVLTVQSGVIALSSGALCAIGVGTSALFPRFVHENPALRVSAWALIIGFFATMIYVALCGVVFIVAWLAAANLPTTRSMTIYGLALAAYLLLTLGSIALPMRAGIGRLDRYEWEH